MCVAVAGGALGLVQGESDLIKILLVAPGTMLCSEPHEGSSQN